MAVELEYDLTGTGWSECTVRVNGTTATVTASYLGDALGDLASAVTAALRGQPKSVARFWEEPGEYRWILEPLRPGAVRIRIIEFPHLWGDRPNEDGRVLLDAECSLVELGKALLACLLQLEGKYGVHGYREKWVEHDFPTERVAEFQELLRTTK